MSRTSIIGAALALICAAYAIGRADGAKFERTAAQANLASAMQRSAHIAELLSRKEQERIAAEAAREAVARDLEDQANAQKPAGVCLPADRVRRLNLR